jgi:hypothetical protein
MTDLSPQARAVLDAAHNRWLDVDDDIPAQVAAAALCAAADQVVPIEHELINDCWYEKPDSIRKELLAIVAELKGKDND